MRLVALSLMNCRQHMKIRPVFSQKTHTHTHMIFMLKLMMSMHVEVNADGLRHQSHTALSENCVYMKNTSLVNESHVCYYLFIYLLL